ETRRASASLADADRLCRGPGRGSVREPDAGKRRGLGRMADGQRHRPHRSDLPSPAVHDGDPAAVLGAGDRGGGDGRPGVAGPRGSEDPAADHTDLGHRRGDRPGHGQSAAARARGRSGPGAVAAGAGARGRRQYRRERPHQHFAGRLLPGSGAVQRLHRGGRERHPAGDGVRPVLRHRPGHGQEPGDGP
ncbi:hypothetical protein LTR94_031641, partial [Friedmanniomyces endolithicus]